MEYSAAPKVVPYECVFVVRHDIGVQEVHKVSDNLVQLVKTEGASVDKREYWGVRSLAYPIKNNKKGHYIMLGISALPKVIKELERNMRINEDIIRYLTVKVKKISDVPSYMMQASEENNDSEAPAVADTSSN